MDRHRPQRRARRKEPSAGTGPHCHDPHDCGFISYCASLEVQPEFPAIWLPRIQSRALKALITRTASTTCATFRTRC